MRGGRTVGILVVVFGATACGKSSRSGGEGTNSPGDGPTRTASFHLIEPVARHIEEAQDSTTSLRTRVSFVNEDATRAIGASSLQPFGAKLPQEEPILWTVAGGTVALGALPGVDPATDASSIAAIDASGSAVVGWASNAGGGTRAFRWTEATGMVDISPPGAIEAYASLVSDDGSVVAGWFSTADGAGIKVFRWTSEGGATDLGEVPGGFGGDPSYLSSDGSVIAGIASPQCVMLGSCPQQNVFFEWSEGAGMQNLGTLSGYDYCYATFPTDVSYGPLITGFCASAGGAEPFIWSEADGVRGLGALPMGNEGGPAAVSEDGRVALFSGRSASGAAVAWRWTRSSGLSELAPSVGYDTVQILGFRGSLSADGSVGIGTLLGVSGRRPVRLTSRGLEELAVPDDHENTSPNGVSRDGKTIAGSSAPMPTGATSAVVWRNGNVEFVADALAAEGVAIGDGVTLPYASTFPNGILVGDADTPRGLLAWIATLPD